jgi:hypothetical protein
MESPIRAGILLCYPADSGCLKTVREHWYNGSSDVSIITAEELSSQTSHLTFSTYIYPT